MKKGAHTSNNSQCIKELPDGGSWGIKPPFLNPDPFHCWHLDKNVARVRINGESCMALLDNGTQINTIMPKYVSDHSLEMGSITNLLGAKVACVGLGNAYTRPLNYIIIWFQVDWVQTYDKDQIALVISDLSNFTVWIPAILGTHTISQVINVMKEAKIDALVMPWANARVAHLLLVCRMMAIKTGNGIAEESILDDYDQVMFTQNVEIIEAFSSHVMLVKVGRAYTGQCINIMVQALQTEDSSLPQGLTVQNTYTELRQGSKKALMVIRNSMAYPQTLQKKPQWPGQSWHSQCPNHPWRLSCRRGWQALGSSYTQIDYQAKAWKFFNELDLSGLDSWPPELVDATHWLLAKYHDVFLLDPAELGCTHSTKHMKTYRWHILLKSHLGGFPCHWLRRSGTTCRRCWGLALSGPARVCGALQWYW